MDEEDAPHSRRSVKVHKNENKVLVKQNAEIEITQIMKIFNFSGNVHLYKLRFAYRFNIFVAHDLTKTNKILSINICEILEIRLQIPDRIVTGDEKWVFYEKVNRKQT